MNAVLAREFYLLLLRTEASSESGENEFRLEGLYTDNGRETWSRISETYMILV